MEIVKVVCVKTFSTIFRVFAHVVFWILDKVEQACLTITEWWGGACSNHEQINLALEFPNGQRQDIHVYTSGNDSVDVAGKKRLKLLVDINLLSEERYEIITAENLSLRKKITWKPANWILQMLSYYVLVIIKRIRECIEAIEHYFHIEEFRSRSEPDMDKSETEKRRKKTPRKKIAKSKLRTIQRFISRIKRYLGLSRTEGIVFDPIEGVGDISLNGSLNNSKLKGTGKRKQPISDSSESDSTEHTDDDAYRSQDTIPLENKNEQPKENAAVHGESDEVASSEVPAPEASASPQELDTDNNLNSSATSNDTENTDTHTETETGNVKSYFDVDEDYKSGDDPDYVPSPNESSSSDAISDEDDGAEDRLIEEAKTEEEMLSNGSTDKGNEAANKEEQMVSKGAEEKGIEEVKKEGENPSRSHHD